MDNTVYHTLNGKKYHKKNCRYIKRKNTESFWRDIKVAKGYGYEACKMCIGD